VVNPHASGAPGVDTSATSERAHPGPASVSLPEAVRDALVVHARAEYPNEMCGLVVGDRPAAEGGRALRWLPTRNRAASPYRYEIDPDDLLRATLETEDADEVFWAIVHSHVRSPARPSPTDIGLAFYPDALYLLVSLAEAEAGPSGEPSIRAWRIVDGDVHEVELRVEQ
jgi:proteasome lid subunit RPN8/RPN11